MLHVYVRVLSVCVCHLKISPGRLGTDDENTGKMTFSKDET